MSFIKHRVVLASASALTLLLVSGCSMTTIREHPDFAEQKRQVKNVAVLPSDVEFLLLVLTGDNERLPEEEQSAKASLAKGLPGLLAERGYQVQNPSAEELQKIVTDASFTIEQAKSAYREVSKQLYERAMVEEAESRKFRVSIGQVGSAVAEALKADAFLFTRYSGFKKSEGLIAKEIVSSAMLGALTGVVVVPAPAGGSMEMALIDGQTGDVLWTNRGGGPTEPTMIAKNLLVKLPATGAVAQMEKANADAKAVVAAEKEKRAAASTSSDGTP
jgi:signal recognition particle subunit SEC65